MCRIIPKGQVPHWIGTHGDMIGLDLVDGRNWQAVNLEEQVWSGVVQVTQVIWCNLL
jgi:hypothetical protein